MYVVMLSTRKAAAAGSRLLIEYDEGQMYDIPDDIGGAFVRRHWARPPTRDEIEAVFGVQVRAAIEQAVFVAEMARAPMLPPAPPVPRAAIPPDGAPADAATRENAAAAGAAAAAAAASAASVAVSKKKRSFQAKPEGE